MAFKNFVLPLTMTSIASSTVTGTYAPINPAGLPQGCVIVRLVNNSTMDVTVSFDGSHDNDYVPLGKELNLNLQTNSMPTAFSGALRAGTKVYVKGTAGTGNIYLTGYYQPSAN